VSVHLDIRSLRPEQKADLIYAQARSDLSNRLWRAALGSPDAAADPQQSASIGTTDLDTLMAILSERRPEQAAPAQTSAQVQAEAAVAAEEEAADAPPLPLGRSGGLGPNAAHQASLEKAAGRTGLPPAALAAIVDAEAAKEKGGKWKLYSRNPRSSAAGLGQFLAGTWIGEAERSGTWLNRTAKKNGWLSDSGRVHKSARSELLMLRYDGEASIQAIADYASNNLDRLRKNGVGIGTSAVELAQAAYLGHHLGPGDAIRFLKGGLSDGHAAMLLKAQVGSASASARVASAGSAASAHRQWLLSYVDRHIQPGRFQA
jgi:hypothetical protein